MKKDSLNQAALASADQLPMVRLPRSLSGFRNFHADETILVCGCGSSLNELKDPEKFITIGVNDIGRKFDPNYLVVLNPRWQFKEERFRYVEQSRARTIFTQVDLCIQYPQIINFKLGKRGGAAVSPQNLLVICYKQTCNLDFHDE